MGSYTSTIPGRPGLDYDTGLSKLHPGPGLASLPYMALCGHRCAASSACDTIKVCNQSGEQPHELRGFFIRKAA